MYILKHDVVEAAKAKASAELTYEAHAMQNIAGRTYEELINMRAASQVSYDKMRVAIDLYNGAFAKWAAAGFPEEG
jgi:hypothetical protein